MRCFISFTAVATILVAWSPVEGRQTASSSSRPVFQSLSPGQSSAWVNHFNGMSEQERSRRVQTFGMPPAPPIRWAHRAPQRQQAAPTTRTAIQRTQPTRSAPRSLYQNHRVATQPARPQVVAARPRVTTKAPEVKPVPVVAKKTVAPKKKTVVAKRVPKKPYIPKRTTAPATENRERLQREVAYMPRSYRARQAAPSNPYAPYASRADYERAVQRTTWRPLPGSKPNPARSQASSGSKLRKFPWPFRKRSSSRKAEDSRSRTVPVLARKSAPKTLKKRGPTAYVSSGLPQPGPRQSRSVIETTLFPR